MANIYLKSEGVPPGSIDLDDQFYDIDMNPVSSSDPAAYYGDIEVRSQPVLGGGGGVLFEPDGGGLPDPGDYQDKEYMRGVGEARKYRKDFLSSKQSQPLDSMLEKTNNGRLGDVNIVKDVIKGKKGDIVIIKDNNETAIKGILEQNSINDIFFSDMNTKVIQDTVRYKVHQNTKKVISSQSQNELYIVMRSIMLQFANFRVGVDNIVDEIKNLNRKVVEYSVENISSNVLQHDGYIKDLSKLPEPLDRPLVSNSTKNFTYDISNLLN